MILLDTNILVHATTQGSAHHGIAKKICQQAYAGEIEACVAFQNLCEWYAVVTDTRRVTKPLSAEQATREMEAFFSPSPLRLLIPSSDITQQLPSLLLRTKSMGPHVFDVVLVATMLEYGVETIYTENTKDFNAFREIRAVNPFA